MCLRFLEIFIFPLNDRLTKFLAYQRGDGEGLECIAS